jgi:hypothetical protein
MANSEIKYQIACGFKLVITVSHRPIERSRHSRMSQRTSLFEVSVFFVRRINVSDEICCVFETLGTRQKSWSRFWIPSSVTAIRKNYFQECFSFTSVAFESRSELVRLEKKEFSWKGLTSIRIPASVEVICEECFSNCGSLTSITFGADCQLSRLEKLTFPESGLTSIRIPASVEVICEHCFSKCGSLTSITFEAGCQLSRLERWAFSESGLTSIHIPASIEVICEGCFSSCHSLASVTFDRGSKLQGRESDLLAGFSIKSRSYCWVC